MYLISTFFKNKAASLFLAFWLSFLLPSMVQALSLGEIEASSSVGEKLNAVIKLDSRKSFDASKVIVSIAPRSIYDRLNVYWEYSHSSLKFDVSQIDNKNALLKITSTEIIYEPYLEFVISVRWPEGLLTKAYTLLLDMSSVRAGGGISAPIPVVTSQPVNIEANKSPVAEGAVESTPPKVVVATPVRELRSNQVPLNQASDSSAVTPVVVTPPAASTSSSNASAFSEPRTYDKSVWEVQAEYGDTLWKLAEKINRESGVDVWRVMNALYKNNPQAFGDSVHQLLANAQLTVTKSQLQSARPLDLATQAPPAARTKTDNASLASTAATIEVDASPVVDAATAQTEEKNLLSIVAESEEAIGSSLKAELGETQAGLDERAAIGTVEAALAEDSTIDKGLEEAKQRVSELESRLDGLLTQYEELNKKTEELKKVEQDLNRRIAEKTLAGINAPASTSDAQLSGALDASGSKQSSSFFDRFGWVVLAFAVLSLGVLVWLVLTRPDRMVHVGDEKVQTFDKVIDDLPVAVPVAEPLTKAAIAVESASANQTSADDWDETAFLKDQKVSDDELAEIVRLKGEKAYVDNQKSTTTVEPVDYNVSDGALELQVAMYIAYERYDEAEELINASLSKNPDNTPLKLQMLEIFSARSDREQFDALAERLEELEDADVNATINSLGGF